MGKRLIPLLTLLALLLAPAGRVAAMESAAMPDHAAMTGQGHCSGMATPDPDHGDRLAIDCMIACAVMAPPTAPAFAVAASGEAAVETVPAPCFDGISFGADPPPPRMS
jgi:hypothetical protein